MKTKNLRTYTVSVSVEASCQFTIQAGSASEAKSKAAELAESLIEVTFNQNCEFPETSVLPIRSDAVEEND